MFKVDSNQIDSESPHSCGHFDTKIEVFTMKNIRAKTNSNAAKPNCAAVGGEPLNPSGSVQGISLT